MKGFSYLIGSIACCTLSAGVTDTQRDSCTFNGPLFDRGDKMLAGCPAGYNLPAQVHLADRDYQGFITASYLYWNAQQDGLDVATTAVFNGSMVVRSGIDGSLLTQGFPYNSGFKVGLGYNFEHCDQWTVRADYTRLHQSNTSSYSTEHSSIAGEVLYLTNWFFQTNVNQNLACTSLSSTWGMDLDFLDVAMSRALYQGKQWIMTPFGGLRASWISESFRVEMQDLVGVSSPNAQVISYNSSSSWGFGPRAGVEGRFLMGMGFRLQGSAAGSLLFTQFTDVSHREDPASVGGSGIRYQMKDYNCVRPMVEASAGFGWGYYFSRNRYHIDLAATYDFNYLWNQNMMRMLNDTNLISSSSSNVGDLSLQGLTVSADFYF